VGRQARRQASDGGAMSGAPEAQSPVVYKPAMLRSSYLPAGGAAHGMGGEVDKRAIGLVRWLQGDR
jgi:hypothetical protein